MLPNVVLAGAILTSFLGGTLAIDTALLRAAGLYECPELCAVAGPSTGNWTRFVSNDDLKWCKESTMLLSLPMQPLADPKAPSVFRACVSSKGEQVKSRINGLRARALEGVQIPTEVGSIQSSAKASAPGFASDSSTAIKELQAKLLDIPSTDTNQTIFFAKRGDSVVGVYVGASLLKQSVAATLMQELEERISSGADLPQTALYQICGNGRTGNTVAGIVADGRGGLESVFSVQEIVKTWADSKCVTDVDGLKAFKKVDIAYISLNPFEVQALAGNNTGSTNATDLRRRSHSSLPRHVASGSHESTQLDRRADCRTIQVVSGDTCTTLANRCGISAPDFTKLHTESGFCSGLVPGQWVCCSTGTLPDMRPKKNADGSCFSYTVKTGEWCAMIAEAHGLKAADIEDMNKKTWGFGGCSTLLPDMYICLSSGEPPMPAAIANARCGPQVAGTKRPTNNTALADLNPCPLKACCNVWGQCGTTEDFCTIASLGAPGTTQPGKFSCISNCGMDIVNNGAAPSKQMTVGYFESWNYNRGCLHMDVTQMSKSISHIHFAFVNITSSFDVSTADVQYQWDKFKGMTGFHKVAAFGGWAASTEPTSYWIYRQGVRKENRDTLANNLAKFVTDNNLDGIDIDWEYPGAQDIDGIPAADLFDGQEYLEFLKSLRRRLGNSKTISIAAPASFWYLQNFPIAEMAKVLDYIVYMTYDLHGQWDYNKKYAMPGCDGLSCLRSHVNMTETVNALSMVTKAGVPANKIVVGVSSYGRSFEMTNADCHGPQCGFTGPGSSAKKGRCTDTNGYISNAEIDEIIRSAAMGGKRANTVQHFTDDSESQILVYDNTHWVAYMDDGNKLRRKQKWSGLNFAGTTDWAVDLATFTPGDDNKQCWLSKHCESPGATNHTSITGGKDISAERWKALCTDSAWDAAITYWKGRRDFDEDGFSSEMSNFFHGTPNFYCGSLASANGCRSFFQCLQGKETGPGASFILNGFVTMSNLYLSMYDGIQDSQQSLEVNGVLKDFVDTFAPKPKPDLALKIILDIVSFGLQAATGPFFNNFLRNTDWGKLHKDDGDNYKDTIRSVITFSFTAGKDSMTEPGTDTSMSEQLGIIVRHYKEAFTQINKATFDGSDKSIDMLKAAIGGGKLMTSKPVEKLVMEDKMTKLFYAMLIPFLWRQKDWSPVVIDAGTDCNAKNGDYLPSSSNICVEGKKYHLVKPGKQAVKCPSESAQHWGMSCHRNDLETMDGINKLTGGKTTWGGLKKEDLVASVLARGKVGWGNPTEGAKWPDWNNKEDFNALYTWMDGDNMIQAPGLIDIPICGVMEAMENWRLTKRDYYSWPCNNPDKKK